MKRVLFLLKYLRYYFIAQKKNSKPLAPFAKELLNHIIRDTAPSPTFNAIEDIRKELLSNNRRIAVTDYGAGSLVNNSANRKISDIAEHTCIPKKHGEMLARLVDFMQAKEIIEIGTSLGISTLYLNTPNKLIKLYTLEGCPETAKIAQANFEKLLVTTIEVVVGNFDTTLATTLTKPKQLDVVFFDGNHRKEATLDYFKQCLPKAHENSVFIFGDIHWSEGMEKAWKEIIAHPQVTISIDLFFFGLLFFKKELPKQKETIVVKR